MAKETVKQKLDPELIKNLSSGDEKLILKTIKGLRSKGNLGYIPELLKVLNNTDNENVRNELARFIADIKDTGIMPILLAGLKDPKLASVHGYIVSACWQSGLNYSGEADLFIRLFMEGDYSTALESFTVLEESLENMNQEDIEKALKQVHQGLKQISELKKPLALELVKLFSL